MIQSVEIQGLRGIREGKLEGLTPLVVLVGPNNAGKSTVLDALLIGASPDVVQAVITAVTRRSGLTQQARWLPNTSTNPPECSITIRSDGEKGRLVSITMAPPQPPSRTTLSGQSKQLVNKQLDSSPMSITNRVGFSIVFTDQHSEVSSSARIVPVHSISEVHLVDAEMHESLTPLYELYTKTIEQGRRKEARTILTDLVRDVEDIVILTEGDKPILQLDYGDKSIPVALAGEGIQSLLRLTLELASRPGGVVLLEEPEVHQHPGAIRQSARAIWSAIRRGIQVIISTHSLELIDSLLSEVQNQDELEQLTLYRLQIRDGCLLSYRMPGSEVAFARTEIEDDLR